MATIPTPSADAEPPAAGVVICPVGLPKPAPPSEPEPRPRYQSVPLIKDLPIHSLEELDRTCATALAAQLQDLARWEPWETGPPWLVSDKNILVVSFIVSPDAKPYVQFLSSPVERTVIWEVASAQYTPGLEPFLAPEHAEALKARGFDLGPAPSNFRREVTIDSPADARRVATESLAILFDTFQYRGPQPLDCRFVADRSAPVRPTHVRLTARQLAFLLDHWGYTVLSIEDAPGTQHRIRVRQGVAFDVTLNNPDGPTQYRTQLTLSVQFNPYAGACLRAVNEFNGQYGPSRATITPDGCTRLKLVVPLSLGLTERYLRATFDIFVNDIAEFLDLVTSGTPEANVGEWGPH